MPKFSTRVWIQCIVNSAFLSCANNRLWTGRALIRNFIWCGPEIVIRTRICRTLPQSGTKRAIHIPIVTAGGNEGFLSPRYELCGPLHSASIKVESQNRINMVLGRVAGSGSAPAEDALSVGHTWSTGYRAIVGMTIVVAGADKDRIAP